MPPMQIGLFAQTAATIPEASDPTMAFSKRASRIFVALRSPCGAGTFGHLLLPSWQAELRIIWDFPWGRPG
jgi:hypothetical protein